MGQTIVNGQVTTYTLNTAALLAQVLVEHQGSVTTTYLYGVGRIATQEGGGEWRYYLTNGLDSVRQLADPAGEVVRAQGYTPFGVPLWSMGSATSSYGFTGEQWDGDVGLLYLRARYYQPATGRFLMKDPWQGNHKKPLTMNLYLYVLASPVKWGDPTGFYPHENAIKKEIVHSSRALSCNLYSLCVDPC